MALKTTIVTALFDIGRENWDHYASSYHTYLTWMKNTLSIDRDMVIFTESKFLDYIVEERSKYDPGLSKTEVIVTEVNQLEAYRRYFGYIDSIINNSDFIADVVYPDVPEMSKPLYNIIMYNKVFWIKQASEIIESDVYIWLDAAAFREDNIELSNWPVVNYLDKIQFFSFSDNINYGNRKIHALGQYRLIQGGCFFVPAFKIDTLVALFNHNVLKSFKSNYLSSDEKVLDFLYSNEHCELNVCNWREYNKFFIEEEDIIEEEEDCGCAKKNRETIFVQIASYRDPQLILTIKDMLEKASNPSRVIIGICRQYFPGDEHNIKEEKYLASLGDQVRMVELDVDEYVSPGVCWARNQIQQLYNNEDYTLQLDSHMRFKDGWDTFFIKQIKYLQSKGHEKPLLTAYAPSYDVETNEKLDQVWVMNFDRFTPEGVVFMIPAPIDDRPAEPIPTRFYSAHMTFTLGRFCLEVQHDPQYYFHGEEISIAVRAFTHGYDLFHPQETFIWHEYHRLNRVKVWNDDNEWWKKNQSCHIRNRVLFGIDGVKDDSVDFGNYGFGSERTLEDYEKYAGIRFKDRNVQKDTLDNKRLPNAEDSEWINHFKEYYGFNKSLLDESENDDLWTLNVISRDCGVINTTFYFKNDIELMKQESDEKGEAVVKEVVAYLPPKAKAFKWLLRRHTPDGWKEDKSRDLPY